MACIVCQTGSYDSIARGGLCEKHDVCDSCGIHRSKITETAWYSFSGSFKCRPCEKKQRSERIDERQKKGFDHDGTDEVVCPHCGYEHGDSWEMGDGERDCPECGKEFEVSRHVSVSYSTEKKGE